MRHALSVAKPSAVLTLPVAVVGLALCAALVFPTGSPHRLASCLLRATRGAVRVPPITWPTEQKRSMTARANPLSQIQRRR